MMIFQEPSIMYFQKFQEDNKYAFKCNEFVQDGGFRNKKIDIPNANVYRFSFNFPIKLSKIFKNKLLPTRVMISGAILMSSSLQKIWAISTPGISLPSRSALPFSTSKFSSLFELSRNFENSHFGSTCTRRRRTLWFPNRRGSVCRFGEEPEIEIQNYS